jgi:hypothetical protein
MRHEDTRRRSGEIFIAVHRGGQVARDREISRTQEFAG